MCWNVISETAKLQFLILKKQWHKTKGGERGNVFLYSQKNKLRDNKGSVSCFKATQRSVSQNTWSSDSERTSWPPSLSCQAYPVFTWMMEANANQGVALPVVFHLLWQSRAYGRFLTIDKRGTDVQINGDGERESNEKGWENLIHQNQQVSKKKWYKNEKISCSLTGQQFFQTKAIYLHDASYHQASALKADDSTLFLQVIMDYVTVCGINSPNIHSSTQSSSGKVIICENDIIYL